MIRVIIFDLDNTFILGNSTYDFIKFYLKRKKRFLKLLLYYFFYLFNSIFNRRFCSILLLKGEKKEDLINTAKKFLSFLKQQTHPYFIEKLKEYKNKNYQGALVSASLDFIVELFAKENGFDIYSGTSLLYDENNICKGRIDKDLKGRKKDFLLELQSRIGKIDFENSICFSDNFDDLELMQLIGKSEAVAKDRFAKVYWENNRIKVLYLPPHKDLINYVFFSFPFVYFWYTRARGESLLYSLFSSYLLFHIVSLYFFKIPFNFYNLIIYLVSFLIHWQFYEIGYFFNDLKAFKEKDPTYRISKNFSKSVPKIILTKSLGGILLLIALFFFSFTASTASNFLRYVLLNFISVGIFLIYNLIFEKSKIKIFILFPLLHLSHFIVPLSIFKLNILWPTVLYFVYFYIEDVFSLFWKKIDQNYNLSCLYKKYIISPHLLLASLFLMAYFIKRDTIFLYLASGGIKSGGIFLKNIIKSIFPRAKVYKKGK